MFDVKVLLIDFRKIEDSNNMELTKIIYKYHHKSAYDKMLVSGGVFKLRNGGRKIPFRNNGT